jgi:hypothetical protein
MSTELVHFRERTWLLDRRLIEYNLANEFDFARNKEEKAAAKS